MANDHRQTRETEEIFTNDVADAQMALLTQIQTSFLPTCQQQLTELKDSLDLESSNTEPNPDLQNASVILSRLSDTMDQLSISANSLAPSVTSLEGHSSRVDHEHGALKGIRRDGLLQEINQMIRDELRDLFEFYGDLITSGQLTHNNPDPSADNQTPTASHRTQVIEMTAYVSQTMTLIVDYPKLSDFGFIQSDWIYQEQLLNGNLTKITQRITGSPIDEGAREDNQARNHPGQQFPLKPSVVELIRLAVPLLKILRIFFNRLFTTPIGKTRFMVSDQMCSFDLKCLKEQTEYVARDFINMYKNLARLHDANRFDNRRVEHVRRDAKMLTSRFDASLASLRFHMVPLDSQLHGPPSGNLFKTLFYPLRSEFRVCMEKFSLAANELYLGRPLVQI
ncbi:hypothetical protein MJO29_004132 [Puccinia striiformis f. sp. tritici]|uniref:Uncharacterized protein n=3 Tax=Puccinia striiformis TaxID=27350 RepID=A0A0L0VP75_9BASI|nr:hypothetical protein MJO29_004132 [Puccinia striiformis f. sp. tritici]KNF01061.1 hypothetical protein PSTG_05691 [Puccinia striiformis f. sp. tritici PST-78]POW12041.1 hypothetical protein PSTT_04880 [Puccinia striiformis]